MADTYNPIIGKEPVPRLRLFQPRPTPEPGIALVLFREGHPLVILWPGDRLTAGEVSWGNYKILYKVDITEHSFDFDCTLPCKSDAFDFHAGVQVTCAVDDPAVIVARNVTDARAVLEPLIISAMRSISRDYDVEKSGAAERAITQAVESAAYNVGLKIYRFMVKLSLEEEARANIRKRRLDNWEIERTKLKMDFYLPLIQGEHWALLAVHLANHPEDVATVAKMVRDQREADMDRKVKLLEKMLAEGVVDGFQIFPEGAVPSLRRLIEEIYRPELAPASGKPGALSAGKRKPHKPEASEPEAGLEEE